MKVCLVNPPSPFEAEPAMDVPLGLAYLGSYLRSMGVEEVTLFDYNVSPEVVPRADVYGITVTTPQFAYYVNIVKRIRGQEPNALIVAGGPHPTVRPHECLESADIDYVIRGEGEQAFYELLDEGRVPDINRVYAIEDLDALPFPMRENVRPYKRRLRGERAFHVVSARSCPYNCSFCSKGAVGTNLRLRSVDNFMAELHYHELAHGVTHFIIYDDTFTIDKNRAIQIAEKMGDAGYYWRCFTRTDRLDEETLQCFKDNNITSITLGVETFSQEMLKVYNKGTTAEDNLTALHLCKEAGIPTRCSLIYGGPYETRETLQETVDGVWKAQPDEWNIATFIPIPGSDVGDCPEKYDVKIIPDPLYQRYHRVGESGMGEVMMDISTMTRSEYVENRKWFVKELTRVCPRRQIQDTIQRLNI